MARPAPGSAVIRFQAVDAANQQHMLALLEDNPMPGRIDVVMTRRPNYLDGLHFFGHEHPVLAMETERIVGCYQLSCQPGFINGQAASMGYLNSLRVASDYRHNFRVLRAGYRDLAQQASLPEHCYTSIASDNLSARRLLERGLPGLPRYRPLNGLNTLLLSRSRGKPRKLWQPTQPEHLPEIAAFHDQEARNFQLCPQLPVDWLQQSGLPVLQYRIEDRLAACALLWDQRRFRQVVVRYRLFAQVGLISLYNACARLARRVPLPGQDEPLAQSFLAFFMTAPQLDLIPLIEDALYHCRTPILTFALPDGHPQLNAVIRHFRPNRYSTTLYAVDLPQAAHWDERPLRAEAAIL